MLIVDLLLQFFGWVFVDLLLQFFGWVFVDLLLQFFGWVYRGLRRALNVNSSAPEHGHTATEYVDAFLFSNEGEDPKETDPSSPPSILKTLVASGVQTRR